MKSQLEILKLKNTIPFNTYSYKLNVGFNSRMGHAEEQIRDLEKENNELPILTRVRKSIEKINKQSLKDLWEV